MRLLVTAFEPFGKSPINSSERTLRALEENPPAGVELITELLPVERIAGPERLLAAFEQAQPDAALCLGQAAGANVLRLERVAVNLLDYNIPDNAGEQVQDAPIVEGGPDAYFATLPLRRMQAASERVGTPCEISLSAGAYLCNQVFYTLRHHTAQRQLDVPVGFLHLPLLPTQLSGELMSKPCMAVETICEGLRSALEVLGPGARDAV
jgi:pyroglutamyl-peptidase